MTDKPKYIQEMPSFKDWEWGNLGGELKDTETLRKYLEELVLHLDDNWRRAAQESYKVLVEGMFEDAGLYKQKDGTILLVAFDDTLKVVFTGDDEDDRVFLTWTP